METKGDTPEIKLIMLKKGDCFMFNREPYKVINIYWEKSGLLSRKTYVVRMKFESYDVYLLPDTNVYRISRGLFDVLTINR